MIIDYASNNPHLQPYGYEYVPYYTWGSLELGIMKWISIDLKEFDICES